MLTTCPVQVQNCRQLSESTCVHSVCRRAALVGMDLDLLFYLFVDHRQWHVSRCRAGGPGEASCRGMRVSGEASGCVAAALTWALVGRTRPGRGLLQQGLWLPAQAEQELFPFPLPMTGTQLSSLQGLATGATVPQRVCQGSKWLWPWWGKAFGDLNSLRFDPSRDSWTRQAFLPLKGQTFSISPKPKETSWTTAATAEKPRTWATNNYLDFVQKSAIHKLIYSPSIYLHPVQLNLIHVNYNDYLIKSAIILYIYQRLTNSQLVFLKFLLYKVHRNQKLTYAIRETVHALIWVSYMGIV